MSTTSRSFRVLAFFLLVSLAATTATWADVITRHYEFPEPTVESAGDYVRVTMDGAWSYGMPGEPVLPMAPARILLPPGEVAVDVQVVPGEMVELGSGFTVEPGQPQYPLSYDGPVARVEPNYAGRASFPARLRDEPKTGFFRGHSIASFALHPVRFEPETGIVSYYRSMDVVVTTAPDEAARESARTMLRGGGASDATLSRMVDNPEGTVRYHGATEIVDAQGLLEPDPAYRYVIITTDAWDDYLGEFVDFQTKRGLQAGVFLKSWILSRYEGVDEPQRIRKFIIDAYRTWGTEYVLLVGDAMDPDGIPHRGLFASNLDGGNTSEGTRYADSDIPGDIYYAALDGNWNSDGDGFWGEVGEADLYPDVAVGRVCANEYWEIENFTDKCRYYQEDPVVSECDEALFVGEYLWPATYGGDYKDEILHGSSMHGYTTAGFPDRVNVETLYEKDVGDWLPSTLITLMENGVNIVNHLGHCNEHHVMKLTPLDISIFQNDGTEHTFNFFYSQGCYGGSFDNKAVGGYYTYDCFTELMAVARVGAAAAIANSRYGWGEQGGTNGSSQYFDREFFDAMFGEGIWALGDANNDSKADVVWAIDYAANRWCAYQLNLFGDPAMHLWTGEPENLTVEHPILILTEQEQMDVTVRRPSGEPVEDARVAVYTDDGRVYDSGDTDGLGVSSLRASTPVSGTLRIKVTAHDFLPYDSTIPVISATEPYLNFVGEFVDDDQTGASDGNGDGITNAGETLEISVSIENLGGGIGASAVAELTCASPHATVVSASTNFGDVPASATVQCQTPFVVELASDTPDGEELEFSLVVSSTDRPDWNHGFGFAVSAPAVEYAAHHLDDDPEGGNGNGCAEAGETVSLELMLTNAGSADATGLTASLSTSDPFVTVNDGTLTGTTLDSGETLLLEGAYSLTLLPGCPQSHELHLNVDIDADWGYGATVQVVVLTGGPEYADDIEGEVASWFHDVVTPGATDAWHVESYRTHSGSHSWKFGGDGYQIYPQSSDGYLSLYPMCIGANGELRFWDWLQAEEESGTTGWDCALVEVSADFGGTWELIEPVGGYTHTKAWTSGNPLPNDTPCWSGIHNWREEVFDLSSLAGQTLMFRFRFTSDEYVGYEGWYVDDVSVTFDAAAAPAPEGDRGIPGDFALLQNVPNPFNPVTAIRYELPVEAHLRIEVYNVAGRLVRTVADAPADAGYGEVVWDGRDATGHRVASGVYLYRMMAGDFEAKRMMVLLK
ncbi:MAG: C25 family cysteine peptidase [Candidatus Eisenbacteria bacterium]